MELRIHNSEKKKLVQEETQVREIEMKFLDKESSRQYSQVMEEMMKTSFRKESVASLHKSKSRASVREFIADPAHPSNFKTANPSRHKKESEKE